MRQIQQHMATMAIMILIPGFGLVQIWIQKMIVNTQSLFVTDNNDKSNNYRESLMTVKLTAINQKRYPRKHNALFFKYTL